MTRLLSCPCSLLQHSFIMLNHSGRQQNVLANVPLSSIHVHTDQCVCLTIAYQPKHSIMCHCDVIWFNKSILWNIAQARNKSACHLKRCLTSLHCHGFLEGDRETFTPHAIVYPLSKFYKPWFAHLLQNPERNPDWSSIVGALLALVLSLGLCP